MCITNLSLAGRTDLGEMVWGVGYVNVPRHMRPRPLAGYDQTKKHES